MSDRERAQELCELTHHDWVEDYYGYRCSQCNMFIPYGCEPWIDFDDEGDADDDYPPQVFDDDDYAPHD